MTGKINENSIAEQPVTERLKEIGHDYEFGPNLASTLVATSSGKSDFTQDRQPSYNKSGDFEASKI